MNCICLLHFSLYFIAVVIFYLPVYSDPVLGHVFQESLNLVIGKYIWKFLHVILPHLRAKVRLCERDPAVVLYTIILSV